MGSVRDSKSDFPGASNILNAKILDGTRTLDFYCRQIEIEILMQFNVSVDVASNIDGTKTFTVNNGNLVCFEHGGDNGYFLTARNLSNVIEKFRTVFRTSGWVFTQPVNGIFRVGMNS